MGFIGVQPASVPLTASDITNDIINADKIADNSISEEHLDATVITGLSELAEAPADTDEFLISDGGTLKRIDASYVGGGGTHELLLTVNASGASTVELNGTAYFKTDYHHFVVYFQNVDLSSNSSFLDVQCGVSSGFITNGSYGSARYGRRTNGDGNSSDLGTGDYVYTQFSLNNGAAYFDGDENIQGELRIWNAFDSHYKVITSRIMYGLQDDIGILDLGGHFKMNNNLTAIRFITPDSATISGTFRLYGVK